MKRRNGALLLFGLSLVLSVLVFAVTPGFVGYENVLSPKTSNMEYDYGQIGTVTVFMFADGRLSIGGELVENPAELSNMLKKSREQNLNLKKVSLFADRWLAYGDVSKVLEQIKQAKYNSVFLVYNNNVSFGDVISGRM